MILTINTDASFQKDFNVGAFAFWSICNEFKITKASALKEECFSPTEAEIKCIVNALHISLKTNHRITKIIINTDSLNAIHVLNNDRKNIQKYNLFKYKHLRKKFNKIINHYVSKDVFNGSYVPFLQTEIEFRHVKAHSGKDDARSYVNEWCDKNAKYYLWQKINSQKQN